MSKKLISLLLTICMLFCLSACGTTETSSNPTSTPSESQTETSQNTYETTSTESVNSQTSSNIEVPIENDTSQITHTHSYSNATCTSPKKCSCGMTIGVPLGHHYVDATCTTPKICKKCNTKTGKALGHSWKNATCDNPKFCLRCNLTDGVSLGHNYDAEHNCKRCGTKDPLFAPIALSKLKSYKESSYGGFSYDDTRSDIWGKEHSDIIYIQNGYSSGPNSSGSETYRISQKYEKMTGTIFISKNNSYEGEVVIFGDGKEIYSVRNISTAFETIYFDINIANVTDIEIYISDPGFYGSSCSRCLAGVTLYPAQ